MPAELRYFDAASWSGPDDDEDGGDLFGYPRNVGYSRWTDARLAWAREHGVSFVDILREQVVMRRTAADRVSGHTTRATDDE